MSDEHENWGGALYIAGAVFAYLLLWGITSNHAADYWRGAYCIEVVTNGERPSFCKEEVDQMLWEDSK
jgi:hypothetical protein